MTKKKITQHHPLLPKIFHSDDKDEFIQGIKHGISLTDGTH